MSKGVVEPLGVALHKNLLSLRLLWPLPLIEHVHVHRHRPDPDQGLRIGIRRHHDSTPPIAIAGGIGTSTGGLHQSGTSACPPSSLYASFF